MRRHSIRAAERHTKRPSFAGSFCTPTQQAVCGIRMSEFADVQLSVSIGGICGVHPITEAIRKADYLMYLDKAEQKS